MVARVAIYEVARNKRSHCVAEAMRRGIKVSGDLVVNLNPLLYRHPEAEVAVFYGFDARMRRIFDDYRAAGAHVVLVDLGYWGRREGGTLTGFHKISVDARHPTAYFQRRQHWHDRVARFGLKFGAQRPGRHILLCGMSAKAAAAEGLAPEQWERQTAAVLRQHTGRPIIYRPKPSWIDAKPIAGTEFRRTMEDIHHSLVNCHAVVTHHSNAAVEGIVAGVPAFCVSGVASPMSLSDLSKIEEPILPDGREQWAADIAYTQFTPEEMERGTAWRHLKNEGLLD